MVRTGRARSGGMRWPGAWLCWLALAATLLLTLGGCGGQSQHVDARLKYFKVVSTRILIEGNQAQVLGDVANTSTMQFPFDVTLQATLLDLQGQQIGTATGTAEDVGPGQVRDFALQGTVDGARYAKLTVTPVSLQEKQQELGMPTPTPLGT